MRASLFVAVALLVAAIPTTAPAQEPVTLDLRADDPNVDRVVLLPSAETQPAGTIAINDYELLMVGLTFAPTDNLQVSATVLPPLKNVSLFANLTAKYRLVGSGRLHLALQTGLAYLYDDDVGDGGDTGLTSDSLVLQGGVLASLCLDGACGWQASASAIAMVPVAGNYNGSTRLGVVYGGGITGLIAAHAKLLFEVDSIVTEDLYQGYQSGVGELGSGAVSGGIRLFGRRVAVDLVAVRPFKLRGPIALPFVELSFRF